MTKTTLQGNIKFHVKWEGYDNKKDLTWEPEENLAYVRYSSTCPMSLDVAHVAQASEGL